MEQTLEAPKTAKGVKGIIEQQLSSTVTYAELEQVLQTGKKLRADTRVPEYSAEDLRQFAVQLASLQKGPRPTEDPADAAAQSGAIRPTDMVDAGILAVELGASLSDVLLAAGLTDISTETEFTQVSRQLVINELQRAGRVQPPEPEDDQATLAIDDGVLRGQLVKRRSRDLTREDRAALKWCYALLARWFTFYAQNLSGGRVWRIDPEPMYAADNVTIIKYRHESPVLPGHYIYLTPSDLTDLEMKVKESFPVMDEGILNEFKRKLASLSFLNHVCARCGSQLPQPLDPKLDLLVGGKFALPTKGGVTKKKLEELGLLDPSWLDRRGRLPEIRFRQVHIECKTIGRLVDELVQAMRGEGADFTNDAFRQDFVNRAAGLLQPALQELTQYPWVTRELVVQRLVDIVDQLTEEDVK